MDRRVRRRAGFGERGEETGHEVGVIGEQRPQLLGRQRQGDRDVGGLDRLRYRLSLQGLGEAECCRRIDRSRCRVARRGGDAAVQQQVDRHGDRSLLQQNSAGLVPDLACRASHAEQFVDGDRGEERQVPQAACQLRSGQRLEPELAPALRRHPVLGERPRRRFEHIPVADVAVGQHVLDVVGEVPDLLLTRGIDGGGGDDLIFVVDQLQQRFLDVARPRTQDDVRAAHLLLARHLFEHRHDLLAQRSAEDVVEVFRRAGFGTADAMFQRPARGRDVLPRIDQGK
jgi:hypothetical protein